MDERLTAYERHADFPPPHIGEDNAACSRWYAEVFAAVPMAEPDPAATPRERRLCRLSASEYIELRRSGGVSCEEYCTVLVKRARYYSYLNQWMASVYDRLDLAVGAARQLDEKAAADGVEAIAPLYGLCIPMKGTAAVVDFPSGSGSGVLSGYTPVADSDLTQLIRERGGVILGTTNGKCPLLCVFLLRLKKQLSQCPSLLRAGSRPTRATAARATRTTTGSRWAAPPAAPRAPWPPTCARSPSPRTPAAPPASLPPPAGTTGTTRRGTTSRMLGIRA